MSLHLSHDKQPILKFCTCWLGNRIGFQSLLSNLHYFCKQIITIIVENHFEISTLGNDGAESFLKLLKLPLRINSNCTKPNKNAQDIPWNLRYKPWIDTFKKIWGDYIQGLIFMGLMFGGHFVLVSVYSRL